MIGEDLRIARMGSGMSARQVASLIGVSHTQILRIELGRLAERVDGRVIVLLRCEEVPQVIQNCGSQNGVSQFLCDGETFIQAPMGFIRRANADV